MGSNDLRPVGAFISHTPGPDCDRFEAHTHMADGSICTPTREPVAPAEAEPRCEDCHHPADHHLGEHGCYCGCMDRLALAQPPAPASAEAAWDETADDWPAAKVNELQRRHREYEELLVQRAERAEAAIRGTTPLDAEQEAFIAEQRAYNEAWKGTNTAANSARWLGILDALRGQPSEPA